MNRAKYVWGAKKYLASFKIGEIREYTEAFPIRSLASIASRLKRHYGVKFRIFVEDGIRKIERVL